MSVKSASHFTVLSDDLELTRWFYCDLLGFEVGWRPAFDFPGWWLYADDRPVLHVVYREHLHEVRAGVIESMAFTATDLPDTVAKLRQADIPYELRRVPGPGVWQLFFEDPHGGRIELDFDKSEPAP